MKKYKAIFFDWDGTAVVSRTAPTDEVLPFMVELLRKGIILSVISGTTYENIAGGQLHCLIPKELLGNLYLGLGRGAYNYGFNQNGSLTLTSSKMPDMTQKLKIHQMCFEIHQQLLEKYDYNTDIVFTRPNYCKIDLLADLDRKGKLFLQPGEIDMVSERLKKHGYEGGIRALMSYASELGNKYNVDIIATTDAKYLEVGISTKSDNIDCILQEIMFNRGIDINECCFWGDEFTFLGTEIKGSDAYMITSKSKAADFFDVSESPLELPREVKHIGGGVQQFLMFLKSQIDI